MARKNLIDAGPVVAYLDRNDPDHDWAVKSFLTCDHFATCEAVLTESFYLLSKTHNGVDLLAAFCETGALTIDFRLLDHAVAIRELMEKYRNIPMDLADACLVLMAEENPQATIITTDRDFLLYRTRNRRQLHLLAPFCD